MVKIKTSVLKLNDSEHFETAEDNALDGYADISGNKKSPFFFYVFSKFVPKAKLYKTEQGNGTCCENPNLNFYI